MTVAALPPVRRAPLSGATATGWVLITLWVLVALLILYALIRSVDYVAVSAYLNDLGKLFSYRTLRFSYGGRILMGFFTTIALVAISFVAGAVVSIPVAAGRLSKNPLFGTLAYAYSYFFRGTPLIAQLFVIYYGAGEFHAQLEAAGLWWFFKDAFNCAAFAFTLNTAAYQSEILSGAIRNVGRGQWEAADALGIRRLLTMRRIVMPQALIYALRPYGNEIILLIKASAISSIVTVLDLMGQTRFIFSKTYDLSFYLWAAVFYLLLVQVLSHFIDGFERRLTRHQVRR